MDHRVIDHGSWLGIHEVHYDQNGRPAAFTANAVAVIVDAGEGPEAVRATLEQMHGALENPVLTPEDFPGAVRSPP
jgi:hypothetical protein